MGGETGKGVPSLDVKNPGVIVLPQDHFTYGLTQDSTSESSTMSEILKRNKNPVQATKINE